MWNFISKLARSSYRKKHDAMPWKLKDLVDEILLVLEPFEPYVTRKATETIVGFKGVEDVNIYIIRNRYAESHKVEVNGSIYLGVGAGAMFWVDLFTLGKIAYGEDHRALSIYKNQQWEGSSMEREVREFYSPLIAVLIDKKKRAQYLKGKEVLSEGRLLKLPSGGRYLWLREVSGEIAKVL